MPTDMPDLIDTKKPTSVNTARLEQDRMIISSPNSDFVNIDMHMSCTKMSETVAMPTNDLHGIRDYPRRYKLNDCRVIRCWVYDEADHISVRVKGDTYGKALPGWMRNRYWRE